jgi:CheY-like chemotaxis protein
MKTVLVVDDHPDTNEMIAKLVRGSGGRVITAFTGEGALALLATERPAVIVLNVMMPGIDGLEVLRLIRTNEQTAAVPVILYSGVSDEAFKQHALSKGANEYWVKADFDLKSLQLHLAKYL